MLKKISTLALAGLLALPVAAQAGSGDDLAAKIDELSRELAQLKAQMATMQEEQADDFEVLEEQSESWSLASRFNFSGDFRAMGYWNSTESPEYYTAQTVSRGVTDFLLAGSVMDKYETDNPGSSLGALMADTAWQGANMTAAEGAAFQRLMSSTPVATLLGSMASFPIAALSPNFSSAENLAALMKSFSATQRNAMFAGMGYATEDAADYDNDTLFTNRFRMNMRVKATENVEFKARLAMYKAWGMQNNPVDYTLNGGPAFLSSTLTGFDGAQTRQPNDSVLRVDRAFVNWNNIGGLPVWFSIGRRPTTDGPPAQLRQGVDKRLATPVLVMDYPFDGLSLGYAYFDLFGMGGSGRIRFCYGRGFESGPTEDGDGLNDTDFAGLSWDVYKDGDRFFNIQSFLAANIFNLPDSVTFANPLERTLVDAGLAQNTDPDNFNTATPYVNGILDRKNLGDIYHTSLVYMDKIQNLNYFFTAGWSRTDPRGVDEMGTGLLTSWWDEDYGDSKDGYTLYAGVRYDMDDLGLKIGLEYNWGSENWLAFTPGHDDLYQSKLATRGHVWEAYLIYDLPTGEAISKYAKTFIRLGYQHYEYDYTGSGFWLGEPVDIDDLADDPLNAQFYAPTEEMDNIYLSMDVYF